MTVKEVQLITKLLRWTVSRIVHALGSSSQGESYRNDEARYQQEDDDLIAEHFPVWAKRGKEQ